MNPRLLAKVKRDEGDMKRSRFDEKISVWNVLGHRGLELSTMVCAGDTDLL